MLCSSPVLLSAAPSFHYSRCSEIRSISTVWGDKTTFQFSLFAACYTRRKQATLILYSTNRDQLTRLTIPLGFTYSRLRVVNTNDDDFRLLSHCNDKHIGSELADTPERDAFSEQPTTAIANAMSSTEPKGQKHEGYQGSNETNDTKATKGPTRQTTRRLPQGRRDDGCPPRSRKTNNAIATMEPNSHRAR